MLPGEPSPPLLKIPPGDTIMGGLSFALLAWAIIGEYTVGIYGGSYFLPLLGIPVIHLLRFRDLDARSFPYRAEKPRWFFDRALPLLVILTTIGSVPYLLAISGVLVETTPLHLVYTGSFKHTGIHHGWVGWYFVTECYFYHRLNRHAAVRRKLGEVWRNALLVLGLFLFIEDFWSEQITDGVLGWADIFHDLNHLLPFSWDVNFAIEIIVLLLVVLCAHGILHFRRTPPQP